jgi:hypothetical protein
VQRGANVACEGDDLPRGRPWPELTPNFESYGLL